MNRVREHRKAQLKQRVTASLAKYFELFCYDCNYIIEWKEKFSIPRKQVTTYILEFQRKNTFQAFIKVLILSVSVEGLFNFDK